MSPGNDCSLQLHISSDAATRLETWVGLHNDVFWAPQGVTEFLLWKHPHWKGPARVPKISDSTFYWESLASRRTTDDWDAVCNFPFAQAHTDVANSLACKDISLATLFYPLNNTGYSCAYKTKYITMQIIIFLYFISYGKSEQGKLSTGAMQRKE